MAHTNDLAFISGEFQIIEFPKDKRYLLKYYKTPLQKAFLRYIFVFGDYKNFVDHTGQWCRHKWMKELFDRISFLQEIHKEAKKNIDLKTLAKIEMGKYK